MSRPAIRFLVAAPYGDVPVEESRLDYPLEVDPLKTTYRQYFSSITDFLVKENYSELLRVIKAKSSDNNINDPAEIIVRTEKHGALYHPASIEVILETGRIKFALNVAVTDPGKRALKKEFEILKSLHKKIGFHYLPEPYFANELNSMYFLLEEWFEGFHEFHISNAENGRKLVKLWEYGRGDRFLSKEESFEIFRQAALILTLFYNTENFNFIYPWHHAAGDFIVKAGAGDIEVKLTTVRDYKPMLDFSNDEINPFMAMCFFLLHLSVHMRLDKLDGVGEVVWAEDYCIDASLQGFFEGITLKNKSEEFIKDFSDLLKSFSPDELRSLFNPLLDYYEGLKDLPVILQNLDGHALKMREAIQALP